MHAGACPQERASGKNGGRKVGSHSRDRVIVRVVGLCTAAAAFVAAPAEARVTRFVVEERVLFDKGSSWGKAGPYERLKGTAYMEVDPRNPVNTVIVNLDGAPKNERGMVELSSPFLILKPVDMNLGNQKIWYGMNNRGNCLETPFRAWPMGVTTCNPMTAADVGPNNILLLQGYAIVDAGWHGDGIQSPDQLFPNFPVATQADGSPIVGPLRLEYQTAMDTFTQPLVTGWRPYETADTDTTHSTLAVRDHEGDPRVPIPSDRWAFGQCSTGRKSLVPSTTDLCLFDGFQAYRIYELIYPAKNPIVMGLAYAVTRDIGSFLRYQLVDDAGVPNPLALGSTKTGISRAYSSGTSSTGMYQREFLYLGFNEDEMHRKVFDAATIYSAATHRLFANVQFAHPTFYSGQDQHQDYTSNSIPPFTFAVTTDPVSGIRDGILKRPATDPLVMQIDEELVFWQWKASLNVVDSAGVPVPIPDGVRLYFQGGFQHIGAAGLLAPPQPPGICENVTKPLTLAVTGRALAIAIDQWADQGIEPPPSNYPQGRDLMTLPEYNAAFPGIPGLELPSTFNGIDVLNFGPLFRPEGGVQELLPPLHGPSYSVVVPKPRSDGDGAAGINTIWTRAPLGTNVGWNIRAGFRGPDLCSLSGTYIPFATTQAERIAAGDSRLSLQERYGTHEGFVTAVRVAGRELVRERFMLQADANAFVTAAEESDVLVGTGANAPALATKSKQ